MADLGLVGVTALWGWSFIWVRDGVADYPVFPFLALRFWLAFFLLAPFFARRLRRISRESLRGGIAMGLALFGGYAFQTTGLTLTSAAHAGFITGLFVVFTPLFESILKRKLPSGFTAFAVVLSTAGLASLALPPGGSISVNLGDLLCLVCAVIYAIHLLITGHMARRHDTACLVVVQIGTVAFLSSLLSVPSLGRLPPLPWPTLKAVVLTAILATVVAYFAQTSFQRFTTPTRTAFIFTLEPVFAGLFAVWLGGESLGIAGWFGGILIVGGMAIGEWASLRDRRKRPACR